MNEFYDNEYRRVMLAQLREMFYPIGLNWVFSLYLESEPLEGSWNSDGWSFP